MSLVAVKQLLSLEYGRSHDGETRQNPFPEFPEVGRHQDNLLRMPTRKSARFADRLVEEDAAIKSLMIGADHCQARIRIEMVACKIGQPQRHIRQFREKLGCFGV